MNDECYEKLTNINTKQAMVKKKKSQEPNPKTTLQWKTTVEMRFTRGSVFHLKFIQGKTKRKAVLQLQQCKDYKEFKQPL